MSILAQPMRTLARLEPRQLSGRISGIRGLTAFVKDLPLPVGALVRIEPRLQGAEAAFGEVVGSDDRSTAIMLFSHTRGLSTGDRVVGLRVAQTVALGLTMLGRVLDGLGRPIDGGPPLIDTTGCALTPDPIAALDRQPIRERLVTGVRAIDCMTTVGKGQRFGIFAGPGVGKSTLLASIARNTTADVTVLGLIGERGREVRDFIDNALGPEGMARSVVIVATGDESPLLRIRAAFVACAAAEFFRDLGLDVVLMMDSLSRFCQAQRQVGLSIGEPPATKGYTPSVFSQLAALLERAGNLRDKGSITGFYTVLVEGDDITEPISDASRAILDGHLSLSRRLANRGHYPAINVLDSVSRVALDVATAHHNQARRQVVQVLADYAEVEELVNIGAYVRGTNPDYDTAIDFKPKVDALLRQDSNEKSEFDSVVNQLIQLAIEIGAARSPAASTTTSTSSAVGSQHN